MLRRKNVLGVNTQADRSALEVLILEIDKETLSFLLTKLQISACPSKPLAEVFGEGAEELSWPLLPWTFGCWCWGFKTWLSPC